MKQAHIYWLPESEGGREILPNSTVYYATTKFPESDNVWSIVIEFRESPMLQNSETSQCEVRLLFEYAPNHLMDINKENYY